MSSPANQKLQSVVEEAWEDRARLSPGSAPARTRKSVAAVLDALDQGRLRVAEKLEGPGRRTNGSRRRCCCLSGWRTTGRFAPDLSGSTIRSRASSNITTARASGEVDAESCLPP